VTSGTGSFDHRVIDGKQGAKLKAAFRRLNCFWRREEERASGSNAPIPDMPARFRCYQMRTVRSVSDRKSDEQSTIAQMID
jgi:hypothetical protein